MESSIKKIISAVSAVMDGKIHSAWLYGSVVLGDFRPGWSDIDMLILTDGEISEKQAQQLVSLRQTLMQKEPENPYFRSFEGIIANFDEYRENSFKRLIYWGTSGQRVTDRAERDPFAEFELAKFGRCVFGNADRGIFKMPTGAELAEAVRKHYDAIRRFAVRTDGRLYSCGWLLDIARCVYTLRENEVLSKTAAGQRALDEHLFADEAPLKKALEIRLDPLRFRDDPAVKSWLSQLGPAVQSYADVLENELKNHDRKRKEKTMIKLEKITPDNWRNHLAVREDQREFVADSAGILARAYAYREQGSKAFMIYNDDTPVGMALIYEEPDYEEYEFSQFFIDARYQGRGFGFEAAKQIIELLREDGKYEKVCLCYIDGDDAARNLYEKLGFRHVEFDEDEEDECPEEIVMQLDLK